jgi:hypothetical protein
MNTIEIGRIMPEERQSTLIELGKASDLSAWGIGRETVLQCRELDALKEKARANTLQWDLGEIEVLASTTKLDVYKYVATLTGKSARSVALYAAVWEFFSDKDTSNFEALPFSHFVMAWHHPLTWESILKLSVRRMDENGGKPPSIEWLAANTGNYNQVEIMSAVQDVLDFTPPTTASDTVTGVSGGSDQSTAVALPPWRYAIDGLSNAMERVDRLLPFLESAGLARESLDRIRKACRDVANAISEVVLASQKL